MKSNKTRPKKKTKGRKDKKHLSKVQRDQIKETIKQESEVDKNGEMKLTYGTINKLCLEYGTTRQTIYNVRHTEYKTFDKVKKEKVKLTNDSMKGIVSNLKENTIRNEDGKIGIKYGVQSAIADIYSTSRNTVKRAWESKIISTNTINIEQDDSHKEKDQLTQSPTTLQNIEESLNRMISNLLQQQIQNRNRIIPLQNPKNKCYINVAIQLTLMMYEDYFYFMEEMMNLYKKEDINDDELILSFIELSTTENLTNETI